MLLRYACGLRRRSLYRVAAISGFALTVLWLYAFLPLDSHLILLFRLIRSKTRNAFGYDDNSLGWLGEPDAFPIDVTNDIALIVKTGYGTQDRLPAMMEASGIHPTDKNVIIIGDFHKQEPETGLFVHDVVGPVVASETLSRFQNAEKVQMYVNLTAASQRGGSEAVEISRAVGWELDCMKNIPGLGLAYKNIPGKKWYMMVDDDTYIIKPSLTALLGHLDPSKPYYLGNQLGSWTQRFGHGGSSFLFSSAAMSLLFDKNPGFVSQSYLQSLDEPLGDRLVAYTFMKVGVYLEEAYSNFFNGEATATTKITPGNLCFPILGFHWLKNKDQMDAVAQKFKDTHDVVFWYQLWELYGHPAFETLEKSPIRVGQDHIGRDDEKRSSVQGLESPEECLQTCLKRSGSCIAWTWEGEKGLCHLAPYFIIGDSPSEKQSGLNMPRMMELLKQCRRS